MKTNKNTDVVKHGVEPRPVQAEKSGQGRREEIREEIENLWDAILSTTDENEIIKILSDENIEDYYFDEDGDLLIKYKGKCFYLFADNNAHFNPNMDIKEIDCEEMKRIIEEVE